MAGLLDLFGGGGGAGDEYGDLLTPAQRNAVQARGLLAMAGAFGEAAMPSRTPVPIGAVLGKAAGALGTGQDEALTHLLTGIKTTEAVRKSQQERGYATEFARFLRPIIEREIAQMGHSPTLDRLQAGAPAATPSPAAVPPAAPAGPQIGAPPAGSGGVPSPSDLGVPGAEDLPDLPVKTTSLDGLLGPGGLPDQVVGQGPGIPQGLLNAGYGGGGENGMPPFRLASAAGPGAGGAPDILNTVIAPLESGNRNIRQQVVGPGGGYNPSVGRVTGPSSAGGYYQITDSTWRDTAPKAGVNLADYPNALSAPREVQKAVAQKLKDERGLQPWADFNPAVARAVGWQQAGARGERPADVVLPSSGGGGAGSALAGLLGLVAAPGSEGLSPPDELLPSDGAAAPPARLASAALAPFAIGNAAMGGPSSVAGVGSDMSSRITAMTEAMPPEIRDRFRIISGYRDAARQAQVNPDVTNSRHMYGAAVDLAKDPAVLDWISRNGTQFGVGFPLASDPRETNHLEMVDAGGGRAPLPGQDYVIPSGRGVDPSMLRNVADTGTAVPSAGTAAAPAGTIPGLGISPQGLAALNALGKLGGLGSPFDSLLETYYKSPGYLGEKAAAETKARTDIEDPLNQRMKVLDMALDMRKNGILYNPQTGEIKADPAWDQIHGRRAEDTKILELDYAKRLKTFEEQQKIAEETRRDQKEIAPQPIYQGGNIVEQPMTREAAVAKLKDQSMRPGQYQDGDIVAKPIGNLSPDHQYKMSPTGGLTVEPIAGTPGAEKATAAARAKDIADRQLLVSRDIVVQNADRLENLVKTSPLPITGALGSILATLGGGPQNDARVLINGLRARASIDWINQQRAATGNTGLGQITEGEHKILADALSSLEQSQSEGQFLFQLRRFKEAYVDAVHGPGAYSKLLPDTPVVKTPSTAPAGTAATIPADATRLRSEAADAIKAGKSRSAVIKRLGEMGVDAGGL